MAKKNSRVVVRGNGSGGFDRRMIYVLAALVVLIVLIILSRKFSTDSKVTTTEHAVAPEVLAGIPREGKGGDPELNLQKNRVTIPSKFEEYTPEGITALKHSLLDGDGRKHRSNWDADAQKYLASMESIGARLTGYLIAVKQSGPESCNGYVDSLRDYHIWVGDSPQATKSQSVIVEMTPRWKEVHPEWRLRYLEKLVESHARVRASGWLFWDEEHANEVDKSRGTQWEVHPVTQFEVSSNGAWQTLDGKTALP